ncbi:MAG: hypothetical protein GXO69_06490, partial [Acidobacteria bacterium]|nr:hypothetical protein [Acidobacteriota bacterium]
MKEALYYRKQPGNTVQCVLCPHNCVIKDGKTGICAVRLNKEGRLFSLNADRVIAAHVDPMEKKPLYHFHPGARTYSIAAAGCNFHCKNCQNHTISQANPSILNAGKTATADDILNSAK